MLPNARSFLLALVLLSSCSHAPVQESDAKIVTRITLQCFGPFSETVDQKYGAALLKKAPNLLAELVQARQSCMTRFSPKDCEMIQCGAAGRFWEYLARTPGALQKLMEE